MFVCEGECVSARVCVCHYTGHSRSQGDVSRGHQGHVQL